MTTIAILHPGEMGAAIGSALIDVGQDDPNCSCQWTAARPANIRCWTRLIRSHAPGQELIGQPCRSSTSIWVPSHSCRDLSSG
jgi:hypothetical protein